MTDDVVVDGSLFFRARRVRPVPRSSPPPVYSALLLHPDVSVGELVRALRYSGLVLTDDPVTGNRILHRLTPPDDAA